MPNGEAFIQMHSEEAAQEARAQRNGNLMLVKGKPAAVEVTLCASSDMNLLVPSAVGAPGQIALGPGPLMPQLVPASAPGPAPNWMQEGLMPMAGRMAVQTQAQVATGAATSTAFQNAQMQAAAQNALMKAKVAAQNAQTSTAAAAAAGNASQLNPSAPSFVPMAGMQTAGGEQLIQLQQPVLMEQSPNKGPSPQQISPHTEGSISHPYSPQVLMPHTAIPGAVPVPVGSPGGPGAPALFAAPGQPIMGPNGQLVQPIIYFYATTIPPTPPMTPPGHLALPVGMPAGIMPMMSQHGPPPPPLVHPVAPNPNPAPAVAQPPQQQAAAAQAPLNLENMITVRGIPPNAIVQDIVQFFAAVASVRERQCITPHVQYSALQG